jgi:hypothetical protein
LGQGGRRRRSCALMRRPTGEMEFFAEGRLGLGEEAGRGRRTAVAAAVGSMRARSRIRGRGYGEDGRGVCRLGREMGGIRLGRGLAAGRIVVIGSRICASTTSDYSSSRSSRRQPAGRRRGRRGSAITLAPIAPEARRERFRVRHNGRASHQSVWAALGKTPTC